jgi:VCBS repeat-containing protein
MRIQRRRVFTAVLFSLVLATSTARAATVTIAGSNDFASLDRSAFDADGIANGVLTINGDLLLQGSINCNDDGRGNAGACSIRINVSGNVVMDPGSAIYAENRRGTGAGGNVTIMVGGTLTLRGSADGHPGAIVSTAGTSGGRIDFRVAGSSRLEAGSVVSSAGTKSVAGAISLNAGGPVEVRGLIAAGPGATLLRTNDSDPFGCGHANDGNNNGEELAGGSAKTAGGDISITSGSLGEPGIVVAGTGDIISQGEALGGTISVNACGIEVLGHVSSLSRDGSGKVSVRSGTYLRIDSRDSGRNGATPGRFGAVRADSTHGTAGGSVVNLIAAGSLEVFGATASSCAFAVTSRPAGTDSKNTGGTINAVSFGAITASGNAFSAGSQHSGNRGGTVAIASSGNVLLDTAGITAAGDYSTSDKSAAGGFIDVRSYGGTVSWQRGAGDVRPTGSAARVSALDAGRINLTSCGAAMVTGTSFAVNGLAAATFPKIASSCSSSKPPLPSGETGLTSCLPANQPPTAHDDAYLVDEGGMVTVAAPGLLSNDSDLEGGSLVPRLVTPPQHGTVAMGEYGSFTYVNDGSEASIDQFQYVVSDGLSDSGVATVTIVVRPVNDVPGAVDDHYTLFEGGSLFVTSPGVLGNDFDADSPALTASLVRGPLHGTLTLHADGSFVYSHDGSTTLTDSFQYSVTDGSLSAIATVFFDVTPVDDPPVANDDVYTVRRGGTLTISAPGVLANDTDEEHDPMTAVLFDPPAHGALTLNGDGSFTYVHDGSAATTDEFTYSIREPNNNSPIGYVTINIVP